MPTLGKLMVHVVEARHLPKTDQKKRGGKSDPKIRVRLTNDDAIKEARYIGEPVEMMKWTKVVDDSLNPTWDEQFEFACDYGWKLAFNLFDEDPRQDHFVGSVAMVIGEDFDGWLTIREKNDGHPAELHVITHFEPNLLSFKNLKEEIKSGDSTPLDLLADIHHSVASRFEEGDLTPEARDVLQRSIQSVHSALESGGFDERALVRFDALDTDGSGSLSFKEVKNSSQAILRDFVEELDFAPKLANRRLKDLFETFDENNDKELSREEYLNFTKLVLVWCFMHAIRNAKMLKKHNTSSAEIEAVRTKFDEFDDDQSGDINRKELKALLKQMGQDYSKDECNRILKEIDTDESGVIEFEEFMAWWTK